MHSVSRMDGRAFSQFNHLELCTSIRIRFKIMKYMDSRHISMILSMLFLNGLTKHKQTKYQSCKINNSITAFGPSCCPKLIAKAVNMYFLIELTDRYDLDMFSLKHGHTLLTLYFDTTYLFLFDVTPLKNSTL